MTSSCSWTNKLRGIVPPLVTPLLSQDTLDVDGTERLLDHVISGGVAGIFILGSSGEGPSLSRQLKRDFCQLCCRIVAGRVPVLVGVSDTCFTETVQLAQLAQQAGASAVVLTSPYYFPCSQDDLQRYVRAVLAAIGDDLPLLLYNMPALTKVRFDIETLEELCDDCPGIVGVKDSSGDLEYFARLCQLRQERRPDDWSIFMGPEHLAVRAIELGADGVIPGGANVEPRLFVSLYETAAVAAANTSESDASRALDGIAKRVDALQKIYEVDGRPWFVAIKCACALRNLCGTDQVALPFAPLDDVQRKKVKDILDGLPPVLFETEGQH